MAGDRPGESPGAPHGRKSAEPEKCDEVTHANGMECDCVFTARSGLTALERRCASDTYARGIGQFIARIIARVLDAAKAPSATRELSMAPLGLTKDDHRAPCKRMNLNERSLGKSESDHYLHDL